MFIYSHVFLISQYIFVYDVACIDGVYAHVKNRTHTYIEHTKIHEHAFFLYAQYIYVYVLFSKQGCRGYYVPLKQKHDDSSTLLIYLHALTNDGVL